MYKVVGDLPNVTIWDMKIKDQGQVVFATMVEEFGQLLLMI